MFKYILEGKCVQQLLHNRLYDRKKKVTSVQGSCITYIIRQTLKHLSLSFYCHITHYAKIKKIKIIKNKNKNKNKKTFCILE